MDVAACPEGSPAEDKAEGPTTPTYPCSGTSALVYGWKGFTGDLSLQTYPILAPYRMRSVAAGGGHVLFLTQCGKVFARGHNAHGQLGLGQGLLGYAQADPQLISGLLDFHIVNVAGGRSHSAAVTEDGDVYCWGDSSEGQCGTGSLEDVVDPTPVTVAIQEGFCEHGVPRPETPVAIISVSCGGTHTLALSVDDEVWAWGCGEQLGLEELHHAPVPRRVEALVGRRVLKVACGEAHSLALVQKIDRSSKAGSASPLRQPNMNKAQVVTQKANPSLCAKCNQDIYTFVDTVDTCIIDNNHMCSVDNLASSLENSFAVSDNELTLAPGEASFRDRGDLAVLAPCDLSLSTDKTSDEDMPGSRATRRHSSSKPAENQQTPSCPDKTFTFARNEDTLCVGGESLNICKPSDASNDQPEDKNGLMDNKIKIAPQSFHDVTQDRAKVISACKSKATENVTSQNSSSNALEPSNVPDNETVSDPPGITQSISVESDGEVWKWQSAPEGDQSSSSPEAGNGASVGAGGSRPATTHVTSQNRTPSANNVVSVVRSKSFLDEQQARQYLAKQFEDEEAGLRHEPLVQNPSASKTEKRKDEPAQNISPATPHSSWKSFLPYGGNMMETVKSMTNKALSNLQTTMDSLVGPAEMELASIPEAPRGAIPMEEETSLSAAAGVSSLMMESSTGSLDVGHEAAAQDSSSSSEKDRSSQSPPTLALRGSSPESPSKSPGGKHSQSLRTLEMKQQNIERRISSSSAVTKAGDCEPEQLINEIVFDTEVWAWGDNQKGQLGIGDTINRNVPVCIKALSRSCLLKIAAGSNHSLALSSTSGVYSWGANSYGQLGHSDTGISPARIKFMRGCNVWDITTGTNHSVFLSDSAGLKPDIFYCGKQPGKDTFSPLMKATLPTAVGELKKFGWIRRLAAGGDNCYCLLATGNSPLLSAVYELAASERSFYQELVKINISLLKPLTKSQFFNVMDVFPYKSALKHLIGGFIALNRKIGHGASDLTEIVREDQRVMQSLFLRSFTQFIDEYRRFSRFFADFLAVGGFEFCARNGSEFFDQPQSDRFSPARHSEDSSGVETRPERVFTRFQRSMQYPFLRLKEYIRLLQKLSLCFDVDSEAHNLLQKAIVSWESLKLTVTTEHKQADTTRLFWEAANLKLADALRITNRRVLRDSKTHPLLLPSSGRFTAHFFILFNDMFVHLQSNTHTIFYLETLWIETPVVETDQIPNITVISPEDRIELFVASAAEKAEWVMAFNAAINKILSIQKDYGRKGSTERLTPPLIRHATHTFRRHMGWKDATYVGMWFSGKMHGMGEMKWPDGRKYTGMFKHGLQHGQGMFVIPKGGNSKEVQDGTWKDGKLCGMAHIRYANGDEYKGFFQNGQRFGHGVFQQGRHLSSYASIYVGEWLSDKRHGYGVQDDILKGEKYMGMWVEDHRHGNGIMVTLDGMYFEGNFNIDKLTGFGLMLTDDNSCYEGEFMDITQLSGKGTLTLPTGDKLEGAFNGSWNEGLKVSGTFIKCNTDVIDFKSNSSCIMSKYYGHLCVPADNKWDEIFHQCCSAMGHDGHGKIVNTKKAWDMVAVAVSTGKKQLQEMGGAKAKLQVAGLEELEKIPPHNADVPLTVESYAAISKYLRKAFETAFHPLGQLMESVVDVFRSAYIGVGAHPRLLTHAVQEVSSYICHIYKVLRILFPQLPADRGPLHIYPEGYQHSPIPTTTEDIQAFLEQQQAEFIGEIVTAASLLHPILLPKIYPPLFDLYALYCERDDDRYWERVIKLNRQGDMALMAFLGIDQKYWLMDDILLEDKSQKLSTTKDVCYASAVDVLQQLSTAFGPLEKLLVIETTFNEITLTVQGLLGGEHVWCMDELFPIFQFVVVRAKIRHLGAEIRMIDDLMEPHLEHGELGIMFTMLKASFFQIQNEKMPHH